MGTVRTDEFRKDAVRIALTSGLSHKQIADDLGVGMPAAWQTGLTAEKGAADGEQGLAPIHQWLL